MKVIGVFYLLFSMGWAAAFGWSLAEGKVDKWAAFGALTSLVVSWLCMRFE